MEAVSGSAFLELLYLVASTWTTMAVSKVSECCKPLQIMLTVGAGEIVVSGVVRHIDRAEGVLCVF